MIIVWRLQFQESEGFTTAYIAPNAAATGDPPRDVPQPLWHHCTVFFSPSHFCAALRCVKNFNTAGRPTFDVFHVSPIVASESSDGFFVSSVGAILMLVSVFGGVTLATKMVRWNGSI